MLNTSDSNNSVSPSDQRPSWKEFVDSLSPTLWQGRMMPAFWTVTGVISMMVNVILLVILISLGRQLFTLKTLITEQVLGGLYYNFVLMDQAHITSDILVSETIQVVDTMPVVFDLQLAQNTEVILTQDTPINNATIILNNHPVPLDLTLSAGTPLFIGLNLTVPVSQTIPVVLDVPVDLVVSVDIPLSETELHKPFIGLQDVLSPYFWQLYEADNSWDEVPICQGLLGFICNWLLMTE